MGIPRMTVKIADGSSIPQMTVRAAAEGEVPQMTVRIADGSRTPQMTVKVAAAGEPAQCCVAGLPAGDHPDSLAGLQFWFKADSLSLNDGDAVATWLDSSSNGYDATQATGSKQPTYQTNEINGKPVIRFDGTDDRLITGSVTHNIGTGDFAIYAVAQCSILHDWNSIITINDGAPGLYFHSAHIDFYTTGFGLFAVDISPNTWYLICVQRNGTTLSLYLNGTLDPTTFTSAMSVSNGEWTLGNEGSTPNAATLHGDIAETMLYNTAHTDSQRLQMEAYFNARYALF